MRKLQETEPQEAKGEEEEEKEGQERGRLQKPKPMKENEDDAYSLLLVILKVLKIIFKEIIKIIKF
jgi:hypothetical protein